MSRTKEFLMQLAEIHNCNPDDIPDASLPVFLVDGKRIFPSRYLISGNANEEFLGISLEINNVISNYIISKMETVENIPRYNLIPVRSFRHGLEEDVWSGYIELSKLGKRGQQAIIEMALEKLDSGYPLPFGYAEIKNLAASLNLSVPISIIN